MGLTPCDPRCVLVVRPSRCGVTSVRVCHRCAVEWSGVGSQRYCVMVWV